MSTVYFGTKTTLVLYEFFAVKEALIEHGKEFAERGSFPVMDKVLKGHSKCVCALCVLCSGHIGHVERWKRETLCSH
jgi:hypothetical protein